MPELPFRRACKLSDVPDRHALGVDFEDGAVAIFRDGESVWAVDGYCPHAFEEMHKAVLDCDAKTVTCLSHHYCFDLKTGKSLTPLAGLTLRMFPIEIREGEVFVQYEADESGW